MGIQQGSEGKDSRDLRQIFSEDLQEESQGKAAEGIREHVGTGS